MANNTYTFVGSEIRPISGIEDSKILSAGYIYDDNYGEKINPNTIMINNLHDILSDLKYGISSLKNGLDALIIRVENLEGGVEYLIKYENGNIERLSPSKITNSGNKIITIDPVTGYSVSSVRATNCTIDQNPVIKGDIYEMSIKDVTGDIDLTINTTENIPNSITLKDGNGNSVNENITISGNNTTGIVVNLSSEFNGLTTKNGKFNVTVDGDVTITNGGTEFNNGTTLTIKRKGTGIFSNNLTGNIKITSKANNTLEKILNITINPILVTSVSISNSSLIFDGTDNKNSNTKNITLSASVSPNDTTQDKGVTFSFVDNTTDSEASIANATLTVKQPGKYTIKATSKANNTITSNPIEFTFNDGEVKTVSISGLPTSIPTDGNTYNLNAVIEDTIFGELPSITWETNIGTLSSTSGSSVKLTIPKNENTSTRSISVSATCDGVKGTASGTQSAQSVKYYWYLGWDNANWYENTDLVTSTNGWNETTTNAMPTIYNKTNGQAYELKGTQEDTYLVLIMPENWTVPTIYTSGKDAKYDISVIDAKPLTINGVKYKLYSSGGTTSDPKCYITD